MSQFLSRVCPAPFCSLAKLFRLKYFTAVHSGTTGRNRALLVWVVFSLLSVFMAFGISGFCTWGDFPSLASVVLPLPPPFRPASYLLVPHLLAVLSCQFKLVILIMLIFILILLFLMPFSFSVWNFKRLAKCLCYVRCSRELGEQKFTGLYSRQSKQRDIPRAFYTLTL